MVLNHYLGLLECDAMAGSLVDEVWAIDHIWYCATADFKSLDSKKYGDCLPLVQEKLIKELQVEESFSDKVKRKINTKLLSS